MILSLGCIELGRYVMAQLEHFFPDGKHTDGIQGHMEEALERVAVCFSKIDNPYFRSGTGARFSHLHSDQYAMFLYILSNTLHRKGTDPELCGKVYCLNKALHGIDVYYEVELPSIFLFGHAVGTVLGRAEYSDYLLVQQNCTIGASREKKGGGRGDFPVLGKHLAVYKGASILGRCTVGDNCKIAAHALLVDRDLERDSIFFGNQLKSEIKRNKGPDNIWLI